MTEQHSQTEVTSPVDLSGLQRAADNICATLDQTREDRDAAQARVGYLEECLRHIEHTASKHITPMHIALSQVRVLARRALEAGDPLTCPEARK